MSRNAKLAELLFPNNKYTVEALMQTYPPRDLPESAQVTRFAPSPTGFLHIGNLFTAMVAERTGKSSGGVTILRIEDTDKKREVEGGVRLLITSLKDFGITFDEGPDIDGGERGLYGPYTQSSRKEIYHAFCKKLVEEGHAYPCFCTEEELSDIRTQQEHRGLTPGYWGEYAKNRDMTYEEVERRIQNGEEYVMRLRSCGKPGGRVKFKDVIRGEIEMEENFIDAVLLKRDGLPTYHFAHVVDDTMMRVTQVIRGEEWIASAPLHLQMFYLCGLKPVKYAHVSPIMKEDGGAKRKLSKRKDPEAAVTFFHEQGFPPQAIMEYLLGIANSVFEDWRKQNSEAGYTEYPFKLNKLSASGALFDMAKLRNVSAAVISRMTAREVVTALLTWSEKYDTSLFNTLSQDSEKAEKIFSIDRGGAKPRKDIACWSEAGEYISYFYDGGFECPTLDISKEDQRAALQTYLDVMDCAAEKDDWFNTIKSICAALGFCSDVKEYKSNPDNYKGHVGDISSIIRIAITGRRNTPDLCAIMGILGQEECKNRIMRYIEEAK